MTLVSVVFSSMLANAYMFNGPQLVVVNDKLSEYHKCSALMVDQEMVPDSKEVLTTLVNVMCPNGKRYDYIVGLPTKKLLPKD